MKIVLNMIVRDEAPRISQSIESASSIIDLAVIVDTGSVDNTKQVVQETCQKLRIPLILGDCVFENYSQARNEALQLAKKEKGEEKDWYLFWLDADDELLILDKNRWNREELLNNRDWNVMSFRGSMDFWTTRFCLLDDDLEWKYPVHELLTRKHKKTDGERTKCLDPSIIKVNSKHEGYRKAHKDQIFIKEERMMRDFLKDNPDDTRMWFYLGNTLRDKGDIDEATEVYNKRANMKPDEEAYISLVTASRINLERIQTIDCEIEKKYLLSDTLYYSFKAIEICPQRVEAWRVLCVGFHLMDWHIWKRIALGEMARVALLHYDPGQSFVNNDFMDWLVYYIKQCKRPSL